MTPQTGFTPHIATLGSGPRKVLALHCTLAFSGAWAGLAREIGDKATIIAPDMPSHGRSPDWDEKSSFPDTVYDAALSCLTEPMDVIGHSFGGAIALRLAVERPDLLRSVTMIEPVFFHIAREDAPDVAEANRIEIEPFYTLVQAGEHEEAARIFNRSWSDGPLWADLPERSRAAMARATHVVPGCTAFLIDDDAGMLPRLKNAAIPALLVRGETTDEVVKVTNAGLARRLPNAREAVIAGAGHMAPVSHPADMAALLRDLWAGSEMRQKRLNALR